MITIQVIPRGGLDAYKMLRDKVRLTAQTWSWKNKARTRLVHLNSPNGYIQVTSADNVLTARIHSLPDSHYFLVEKFIGRLVAWFPGDIFAINVQFVPDESPKKRKR